MSILSVDQWKLNPNVFHIQLNSGMCVQGKCKYMVILTHMLEILHIWFSMSHAWHITFWVHENQKTVTLQKKTQQIML